MSGEGKLLGDKALEQIRGLLRDERSRYQNPEGHRPRYTGTQCCSGTYTFLIDFGPASGTVTFEVTYKGVTQTITAQYNETPENLKTLIDAHSQFVAESKECVLVDYTGDLDRGNIVIGMPTGTRVRWSGASLVRSNGSAIPEFRIWSCAG